MCWMMSRKSATRHVKRLTKSSHAAIEKMTVDALKGWLLRNDDRRHYREKHSFFHDENYMRVVISDEAAV